MKKAVKTTIIVDKLGVCFEVDVGKLIHKIYVSPDSGGWFKDLVSAVLRRYGLSIELEQSNLNNSPVY